MKKEVSVAACSSSFTCQGKACHFHFHRHFSSLSNNLGCLEDAFPPLVMTNISHLFCSVDYLAILNFFLSLGGQSGAGNSERDLIHSVRI